jgi:hypothetical protein
MEGLLRAPLLRALLAVTDVGEHAAVWELSEQAVGFTGPWLGATFGASRKDSPSLGHERRESNGMFRRGSRGQSM